MKKMFCAVAVLAALFTVSAVAQQKRTPVPSFDRNVLVKGRAPILKVPAPASVPSLTPPPYCTPNCLFYGGDTNQNASNDNGFANENTLLVPDTTVWGAFTVPSGQTWSVSGLFINTIPDGYNGLDPINSAWSINVGVSEGNAGSSVASGTSSTAGTSFVPTGRTPFGFTEYTLKVKIPTTVLTSGTYWVNVTPQCTNGNNGSCSIAQYFWDDTFGQNRYGPLEPADQGFFNSAYFGFNYANLCEVSTTGCQALSFGVIGVGH